MQHIVIADENTEMKKEEKRMEKWTGWRDVYVAREMIGGTVEKGGEWQEEMFRYIRVPYGYNYDDYVFLVSEKYVRVDIDRKWYFCIRSYETIELFYDPQKCKPGKKYKRYKMTGYELYERLFENYEGIYLDECEEMRKLLTSPEDSKRTDLGVAVCGVFCGNICENDDDEELHFPKFSAFFRSNAGTFSNSEHRGTRKVNCVFEIMEMSKQEFIELENVMNDYIADFGLLINMELLLEHSLKSEDPYTINKIGGCIQWAQNEVEERLKKTLDEIFNAAFEKFFERS